MPVQILSDPDLGNCQAVLILFLPFLPFLFEFVFCGLSYGQGLDSHLGEEQEASESCSKPATATFCSESAGFSMPQEVLSSIINASRSVVCITDTKNLPGKTKRDLPTMTHCF